ncbi:MAG: CxxxxCH/CxxCH domain-containing protein [Deltaproteobacteria bacterium]|nr:CxxxxCH/CxxCH domain-containing protein [Deltaproteobacteria bacterium]
MGAHQSHLEPADWHADVPCSECHVVPAAVESPGHIDGDGVAEVTFGDRATEEGATPAWSGVSCSGAYCHGATLSGGTMTAPVWTMVDGTQVACGTCHSLPPTEDHPALDQCYLCHDSVIDETLEFVDPTLHINGDVDF